MWHVGYGVPAMAEYDPSDPATWDAGDAVDVQETARRITLLRLRNKRDGLAASYLQRNLSRRPDYPAHLPYEINSGRAWKWGEVLAWFEAGGRL